MHHITCLSDPILYMTKLMTFPLSSPKVTNIIFRNKIYKLSKELTNGIDNFSRTFRASVTHAPNIVNAGHIEISTVFILPIFSSEIQRQRSFDYLPQNILCPKHLLRIKSSVALLHQSKPTQEQRNLYLPEAPL